MGDTNPKARTRMNAMRLLAVVVVAGLLGVSARADDKPDNAKLLVGKWECTKADPNTLPVGSTVEFTKDGKFKMNFKMGDMDMAFDGTYKVEGDKFTFTIKLGDMDHSNTITIK